jgi:hypothetical protein
MGRWTSLVVGALVVAEIADPARLAQVRDRHRGDLRDGCPFTGPAKELGRQMKIGLEVAFGVANDAGGVAGRKVKLIALDDGYEPTRTKEVMKDLAEQRKVFAFVGNVGTPTAMVALPYALERKMLFFGPFTGASLLRKEPPDRYVFNYRASYVEETAATVKYLRRSAALPRASRLHPGRRLRDAGFQGARAMRRSASWRVPRLPRSTRATAGRARRCGARRSGSEPSRRVPTGQRRASWRRFARRTGG